MWNGGSYYDLVLLAMSREAQKQGPSEKGLQGNVVFKVCREITVSKNQIRTSLTWKITLGRKDKRKEEERRGKGEQEKVEGRNKEDLKTTFTPCSSSKKSHFHSNEVQALSSSSPAWFPDSSVSCSSPSRCILACGCCTNVPLPILLFSCITSSMDLPSTELGCIITPFPILSINANEDGFSLLCSNNTQLNNIESLQISKSFLHMLLVSHISLFSCASGCFRIQMQNFTFMFHSL